jgi:hypothetical protein
MGKVRTVLSCRECGQQLARWAGRCPGCGAWGTIEEGGFRSSSSAGALETLAHEEADERRVSTGTPGIDRVLGGGLVPSTVALLAGSPASASISRCQEGAMSTEADWRHAEFRAREGGICTLRQPPFGSSLAGARSRPHKHTRPMTPWSEV